MNYDKNCPCYNHGDGCSKRRVGCHSSCEEYTQWCVERSKVLNEEDKVRSFENDFSVTKKLEVTRMTGKKVGIK